MGRALINLYRPATAGFGACAPAGRQRRVARWGLVLCCALFKAFRGFGFRVLGFRV